MVKSERVRTLERLEELLLELLGPAGLRIDEILIVSLNPPGWLVIWQRERGGPV